MTVGHLAFGAVFAQPYVGDAIAMVRVGVAIESIQGDIRFGAREPLVVDTSRVNGYDILVSYVPDAVRFKNLVSQEMPLIMPEHFRRLLAAMQMYPEVRRQPGSDTTDTVVRKDVKKQ